MGLGETLSLICALMWASAVIIYKSIGNSLSANTLNLVKNLIALGLLMPTALLIEGLNLPQLSATDWVVVCLSGYIGIALADTFFLQALRYLGASRTAIVASLYSPFVVMLSIVFLGETLLAWQWLGFALVMLGILIVIYQRNAFAADNSHLVKGVVLATCSVFFTASGVVALKPLLVNEGFFWITSLRMLAGIVGMLLFALLKNQIGGMIREVRGGDHPWFKIMAASFMGSYLALLFWLGGFKYADASVASVLNETSNIFIVLMAWLFLNESLSKRKILGMIMTFSGVLIFLGLLS